MNPLPRFGSTRSGYLAAAGTCALTTLLATPLLGRVDLANIALLFVLAVVVASARWGRGAGVFAAFAAVACFDFFFVPPRFSFTVAHFQYLIIFAVMLVVSLVISHLTNVSRDKAIEAERRAGEASFLHELAGALSGALTLDDVGVRLADVAGRHFGAGATLFLPDADERVRPLHAAGQHIEVAEQVAAQGVYASGEATHANRDLHDGVFTVLTPLVGATCRRGVLGLHFADPAQVPAETLTRAVAAVVVTAVERIHFVEVAQASSLEIQSERLRNSILSALSHDLRTPLTVLYGLADELAQRSDLPADAQATAAGLRDQSHRLHRMVDNLLDLARLKSGRVVLRRDWQSVPELAGACVQAMTPWLGSHRVGLDMAADLPLIELDAVLIERVFCNLLENAAKYSLPDSTIRFGAALEPGDPSRLAVWVANDGGGFAPDRLQGVFEMFERGAVDSRVPGVGIGLAVCRAIVDAHGGSIAAANLEGGAEIRLRLPLREAPPLLPEPPEPPSSRPAEDRDA